MNVPSLTKKTTRRRLAVALLAAALVVPAGVMVRRAIQYRRAAGYFANLEILYQNLIRVNERMLLSAADARSRQARKESIERFRTLTEYHGRMRRKYEHAAHRPWLPVAPDPPPPQ